MTADFDRLWALAEAATQSPLGWEFEDDGDREVLAVNPDALGADILVALVTHPENGFFIAAANPATILALRDRLDELQAEVARLLDDVDELGEALSDEMGFGKWPEPSVTLATLDRWQANKERRPNENPPN